MAHFIVIDGLDGCGKATQTELLKQHFEKLGYTVVKLSFPDYESNSSAPLRMYLNGEIGTDASKLNPYMCSTFFAVDRFIQFKQRYEQYFKMDDNAVILADRYVASNIILQGGKISDVKERQAFIDWAYDFECRLCGLPVEELTVVLTIPPSISQKLLENRYNGDNTKKDIHESSLEYQNECYNRLEDSISYLNSINHNWKEFSCTSNCDLMSVEDIQAELIKLIKLEARI